MRQHIVPEVLTNLFIVNLFKNVSYSCIENIITEFYGAKIASYLGICQIEILRFQYNSEIAVEIVFMHSNFKRYVLNLKKFRVQCMNLDRDSAYEINYI